VLFLLLLRPLISTLFPYTTLFRSWLLHCFNTVELTQIYLIESILIRGKPSLARASSIESSYQLMLGWLLRSDSAASALSWRAPRSEEHTSELQSLAYLVCRLLLEK